MKKSEFKPIRISGITNSERFEFRQIKKSYVEICNLLDSVKVGFDTIIYDGEKQSSLELFTKFIDSKEPDMFIRKNFIEFRKINIPGLKTEALTKNDLLDISTEYLNGVLDQLKIFKSAYSKVDYHLSIKDLYTPANTKQFEFNGEMVDCMETFEMPDDFEQKWEESKAIYTVNEEQNTLYDLYQKAENSINDLIEFGAIPADERWGAKISNQSIFTIDKTKPRPLTISRNIFRKTKGF